MSKNTQSIAALLATCILVSSCATPPKQVEEFKPESTADIESIAILGTNDLHGALAPQTAKTKEANGVTPVDYERGGAAAFSGQVSILREQFGSRLIWLDAGDQFQGSLESNLEEGASMVRWLNALGLNASAVGNHEFDFGPVGPEGTPGDPLGALKARLSEAKYPYLAANLQDRQTGSFPKIPNLYTSALLTAGRLKVGVIGLSTLETPVQTRPEYVKNLAFEELRKSTLREVAKLRAQGAQIIVGLAHAGTKCVDAPGPSEHALRKASDPQGGCDNQDELSAFLHSVPEGTLDAVISGHRHQIIHHWIEGVPVIQGGTLNQFFNLIYFSYDFRTHKIIPERTRIEGPVPICSQFFENQRDCSGDRPAPKKGRGNLVTATFHGRTVNTPSEISAVLDPIFEKVAVEKKRIVAQAARPVQHVRPCRTESELGALVADAMRLKANADVALVNCGMIRSGLEQGNVTYGDVFRTIPFDNTLVVMTVSGQQLKTLLRVAQSGSRGFFPTSGLKLKILDPNLPAKSTDLDGNGKIEAWEINRLVEARLSNGAAIDDHGTYRLATVDFLVSGGDDMGWAMNQVPRDKIKPFEGGLVRSVVENYLTKLGTLNSPEHPALDPANPRITFVKQAPQGAGKSRGKTRRKRKKH